MSEIHPETPLGSPKPTVRVISDGKPAPELAAAMAETRAYRELLAAVLGRFTDTRSSGWTARVSGTQLHRWHTQASLPMPVGKRSEGATLTPYEELDIAYADARDTIDELTPALAEARAALATCRERNAAIAVQLDQYRDERDCYRAALDGGERQ